MLVQTQAFMDAFKAPTRALHFRLTINNVIYTKDRIKSVDVNFGNIVDENFSVGTTYSNSLKVVFSEVITTFNEMDNVKAEIGIPVPDPEDAEKTIIEYSSLGHFLISERVDINRNDKITSLFCLDKMILMEQEYVSQLTYPAGIDQVALEIANLSGAVIDQTSFERIGTTGINKMVGYTYREAIGLIAQLEAGFATFDRQGKLAIRQLNDTTFTITPNEYFLKGLTKNDLQYRLGGISVKVDENTTLQAGSATGSQIVLENSVMTQILLDGLWQQLSALNFYPFTLDWRGNPVVEIGDWVTLTDIDGNLFKAPVLGYSLTYNGGLTAKMSGDVETMPANTVQYTPPLQQTVKRLTNAIVKANGNVNYYDIDTPANPKVGDLWFKPNGPNTDLYMYYEKNGILGWHLEVSDTQSNVLSDKVEIAKEIAEAAKSRADDVWAEVDLAVANAGVANLDALAKDLQSDLAAKADATATEMELAKKVAQTDYNTKVQALQSDINAKVARAAYTADKLLIEAEIAKKVAQTTYDSKINALDTAISGHTTRIEATETGLLATASSTEVNALKTRMTTAETSLTTNTDAIALKASQSDLDTVEGRLSTAESSLTVQANQIVTKVTQTDIDTAIGNIKVGGRNYFRPQKVSCYYEHGTVTAKTEDGFTISYLSNINKYLAISVNDYVPQSAQYTFSGYLKVNGVIPSESIFAGVVNDYGNSFIVSEYNSTTGYFKFTQNFTNSQIWIIHGQTTGLVTGDLIKFEKVMFEFGNKASDFVPATEDTDLKISSVSSSLTVEAGKITALTTRVGDNEFATAEVIQTVDGIETSLVNYANKTDLNGLASETWVTNKGYQTAAMVSQTLSSYAKSTDLAGMVTETYLNNNNYQTAAMIEQVLTSYAKTTALNGLATESWVSNKNYQTAAQITTTLASYVKGSDFSSFQTTYNQKATGWDATSLYVTNNQTKMNSLISNADGLISTVQTIGVDGINITQMVLTDSDFGVKVRENIEVGGRNLFKNSELIYVYSGDYGNTTKTRTDGIGKIVVNASGSWEAWGFHQDKITDPDFFNNSGQQYTISLDVKASIANDNSVTFDYALLWDTWTSSYKVSITDTSGEWVRVSATITIPFSVDSDLLLSFNAASSTVGDTIEYRKFKLDKGNVATAWTPAIEEQVMKGESYSQLLVDAQGILFDTTGNLVLSAEHVIFDTVNPVVIPSAAIPNLSADKITTGTLNAANVNVVNVNANNITGKNASLIRASFNDINSSVQVDGTGLTTVDVTGLYAKYASGAITFGGGGEVVRMKNNTGNNPNRSGVALEPINSAMSNIDLDLYTRGIASLNIGKSDYDDGYRLRISSELANTNNYYFSLKSGTSFSFNFDARNYTDSRNSMQILQHNSDHHSIGKNQNWGSQLHFVNDDLIVAKGGTGNRTNLFAGGLYGRGVYYQYGTLTYDIAGTIADILSWIGSGVTWRMKS